MSCRGILNYDYPCSDAFLEDAARRCGCFDCRTYLDILERERAASVDMRRMIEEMVKAQYRADAISAPPARAAAPKPVKRGGALW